MRFSDFDTNTQKALFAAYDEAMRCFPKTQLYRWT